jgi:hypothetical protein
MTTVTAIVNVCFMIFPEALKGGRGAKGNADCIPQCESAVV